MFPSSSRRYSSCIAYFEQEIIITQREIAEVSIQCARVFLVVRRGTLGKLEAEINPSVLVATSDLTRYVVPRDCWCFCFPLCMLPSRVVQNIHCAARQCLGRKRTSMVLYAKTDKDRIAGWKEELTSIMHIFNVRRSIFHQCCVF